MPLTLQNIGDASSDLIWVSRVKAAILEAAISVMGESVGTPNHALRITFIIGVLREPDRWASRISCVIAAMPGPASAASLTAVTDSQVTAAVNQVLDSYAVNGI